MTFELHSRVLGTFPEIQVMENVGVKKMSGVKNK
jgi:hypothetical protein